MRKKNYHLQCPALSIFSRVTTKRHFFNAFEWTKKEFSQLTHEKTLDTTYSDSQLESYNSSKVTTPEELPYVQTSQ